MSLEEVRARAEESREWLRENLGVDAATQTDGPVATTLLLLDHIDRLEAALQGLDSVAGYLWNVAEWFRPGETVRALFDTADPLVADMDNALAAARAALDELG